jgi:hypothetical protein
VVGLFVSQDSGALVWWILVPVFAAVGLYLIWYSRRRKKMLEAFARMHRLRERPDRVEDTQQTLDRCFSLTEKAMARSFGQLSSLIDGGPVRLFRVVELLDLDPHARSYSTHFSRIAALFEVPAALDAFFVLDGSRQVHPRAGSPPPDPEVAAVVRRIVRSGPARHPLSVTLARGHGLIYFEPLVTGGERAADIDALYRVAQRLHAELQGES